MIWLDHYESRSYDVMQGFDGADEIASAEARIKSIARQPSDGFPQASGRFPALEGRRDERPCGRACQTRRDLIRVVAMNKVVDIEKRDYSLVGSSAQRALELGLASAEWYRSDVPRATMKELVRRSDAPAIRDTIIWIAAILLSAAGLIYFTISTLYPLLSTITYCWSNAGGIPVFVVDPLQ